MDTLEPNPGADRPVHQIAPGVFNQRHGRLRNAACTDRRVARNQAHETGGLQAAAPRSDRLPIQAKPPGRSFDPVVRCIVHDGEAALDGVVIPSGIFSVVNSLVVIVDILSLLQWRCDSSAVEGPILNKIFQLRYRTVARANGNSLETRRSLT
jgi:hypothetical protein